MSELPIDQQPCHYCGRDTMPPMNADHAEDCPSNTGIFPVEDRDVLCPGGCGCYTGLRCAECGDELKVGDHYAHLSLVRDDLEVPGMAFGSVEVVCLVCAAKGVVTVD